MSVAKAVRVVAHAKGIRQPIPTLDPKRKKIVRPRRGQYIKLRFATFDALIAAVVHPRLLLLYLAMRTYVWRSDRTGHPRLIELLNEGKLAVRMRQERLGELVGVRRQHASVLIGEMLQLGWIERDTDHRGPGVIYVLGNVATTRGREEVYFFDSWAEALAERVFVEGRMGASTEALVAITREAITNTPNVVSRRRDMSGPADTKQSSVSRGAVTKKREALEEGEKETNVQNGGYTAPSASFSWVIPPKRNEAFEIYRRRYEARARRTMSSSYAAKTRREFDALVRRVGAREARRATEIALGEKWISEPVGILTRPNLYDKHIAPLLSKSVAGEQAEWTGPRGRASESRMVTGEEFFGRSGGTST